MRRIAQRAPGDGHLDRPAVRAALGAHAPGGVPLKVLHVAVEDLLVAADAPGVGLEHHRVVPVAEGVEAHAEHVVRAEIEVAAEVAHAHGGGAQAVPASRADVEVRVVVDDPDLRVERRGRSLPGLDLAEAGHRGRGRPVGLVEAAVQVDGTIDAPRLDPQALGWRGEGVLREQAAGRESYEGRRRQRARTGGLSASSLRMSAGG